MVRYVVDDDVKYRREGFGCVTLNRRRQETRFFNRTAALIIEQCRVPVADADLAAKLEPHLPGAAGTIRGFLDQLVEDGVLAVTTGTEPSAGEFYYLDITRFAEDHLHAPLGVEIELTLKCLRSCRYCAYDAHPKAERAGELGFAEWREALGRLREAGVFFLRFTGGDPLLRDDFAELLNLADSLGFVVTVGSDLTSLGEAEIAALARTDALFALQTTLDGATEASADRLRGPGNFRAVTQGIRRLTEAGVPVIVGTVLTRHNIAEIGDIGRLVGALGAAGYCVAPLYAAGRAQSPAMREMIPTNEELSEAAHAFRAVVESGAVAPADPAWLEAVATMGESEFDRIWEDQSHLLRRPDRLLRIDPRGRAYVSVKLKPSHGDQVYIGSIRDIDVIRLWHDAPLIQALRTAPGRQSYFGAVIDSRGATISEGALS